MLGAGLRFDNGREAGSLKALCQVLICLISLGVRYRCFLLLLESFHLPKILLTFPPGIFRFKDTFHGAFHHLNRALGNDSSCRFRIVRQRLHQARVDPLGDHQLLSNLFLLFLLVNLLRELLPWAAPAKIGHQSYIIIHRSLYDKDITQETPCRYGRFWNHTSFHMLFGQLKARCAESPRTHKTYL